MWDLEHLLLFGVPGNKTEIIDGRGRWVFPFLERAEAEAHIELRIPFDMAAFRAIYGTFYRRDLWPDQPPGRQEGYDLGAVNWTRIDASGAPEETLARVRKAIT